MCCARLFIDALWSPAGKGLTSWLSFVMSFCEFVTFPLVSWVRLGTSLCRFLIFALFLTVISLHAVKFCIQRFVGVDLGPICLQNIHIISRIDI